MPSGATHTAVNLAVLLGAAGVLAALPLAPALKEACGVPLSLGYLYGTLLVTPDLDLAGHVRVTARRHWGVLGALWMPLSLVVKHRGVTHTYVRGPLLLLGYSLLIVGLCGWGAWQLMSSLGVHVHLPVRKGIVAWAFLGYLVAYWLHLVLDRVSWKRW